MSNRTDMNTFEEFSNIPNDTVSAFNDKFVTEEQKQRDTEVTRLLAAYVKHMKRRQKGMLANKTFYFTHVLL